MSGNDDVIEDETLVGSDCDLDDTDTPETLTESVVVDDSASIAAPLIANPAIKYAPVIPPVQGNYTLYCVVLKWLDNPGEDISKASGACRQAASIYRDLSAGLLNFDVVIKSIKVNYNHERKNLNKAEQQAKNIIGKPPNQHVYAIFNNHVKDFSEGSGDTAHLLGTLTRDVCHEVGHCEPTHLGHAGVYKDGKLYPYDDGTSFMGRFASSRLTAPQLYTLGWLPENKVALYEEGDAATDFNIESLFALQTGDNLKMVLIPRGQFRPLHLSMPQIQGKPTLCLHLSTHGGSQRVATFGSKATYENIMFEKIATGTNFVTVRVSTI